jgi:hypothetical protein
VGPSTPAPVQEPFNRSIIAAFARADRASIDDLGTTLARQAAMLRAAGRLLQVNYRSYYEHETDGWARLVLFTEGLYQQMHAAATTAAVLVGRTAEPRLKVDGLSHLLAGLEDERSHPLAPQVRRERRSIELLRWLLTARNKTVQHRAEAGYVGERGMVLLDGFVVMRRTRAVDPKVLRKARDLFQGMCNKYGEWNETPNNEREALTYLDLGSHELWDLAPADFDSCRRVIAAARCYDLVVSLPLLENADAALATLIEMAPLRV